MLIRSLLLCLCLGWSSWGFAKTLVLPEHVELQTNYPETYVVKANDTVWDVLSHFVVEPWDARDVWTQRAPEIFSGDQVSLVTQGLNRLLQIKHNRVVKLSPGVHSPREKRAIDIIPISNIQQFLNRPYVVTTEEMENAPYVVGSGDGRLLMTQNTVMYARGLTEDSEQTKYVVLRTGRAYTDPVTEEVLAHEGVYLGEALLQRFDPETGLGVFRIQHSEQDIRAGDRLLPLPEYAPREDLIPNVPDEIRNGVVLAVIGGLSQVAQFQVVVLNKGEADGIEEGHVLATYRGGDIVRDHVTNEALRLPKLKSGVLIVFKVFERVSYALVMEATSAIYVLDQVDLP